MDAQRITGLSVNGETLHAILARSRDLGVVLLELRRKEGVGKQVKIGEDKDES